MIAPIIDMFALLLLLALGVRFVSAIIAIFLSPPARSDRQP